MGWAKKDQTSQLVLELPHVAGPGTLDQEIQRSSGQAQDPLAGLVASPF